MRLRKQDASAEIRRSRNCQTENKARVFTSMSENIGKKSSFKMGAISAEVQIMAQFAPGGRGRQISVRSG